MPWNVQLNITLYNNEKIKQVPQYKTTQSSVKSHCLKSPTKHDYLYKKKKYNRQELRTLMRGTARTDCSQPSVAVIWQRHRCGF